MAILKDNMLLIGLSGSIGKQFVVKWYKRKAVVTRKPDMSKVKWTGLQADGRLRFREAVRYARDIMNDPVKRLAFSKELKKGESIYHSAIRKFLT
jgi:hypothetical protein